MIIRDPSGKIIIIMRKDCLNERVYNQKIYDVMSNFSSILIPPKLIQTNKQLYDFEDD